MKKKMLFVYNPMAGKEQIRGYLSDIIQIFCKAEFEVTIVATSGPGEATEIVAGKGSDYDYIVCSGGDGTMNEVAGGVMQLSNHPVIGYIPAGTVNDFASTLRIPKMMPEAAELITKGDIFSCDLGKFNDRYFTYVAGFGAFTEVSYQTPQDLKNALGKTAYFVEALKHIAEIKPHHMKIEYDDGAIEDEFLLGLVSNSESVSGYKAYSLQEIKMDDGLFEALFIRNIKNPLELQMILNALLTKKLDAEQMCLIRTKHLHIVSDDDVQWTLDGEDGGWFDEVTIDNVYHAIQIMCDYDEVQTVAEQIGEEE
ncbi:MAG: YegS/Rv2252/BmrU family lipid kinase [Eubacteriales bacterium]|nr:YegS/Rv2252/BmrU family lipid kinase [Eubacteriales bacterium]